MEHSINNNPDQHGFVLMGSNKLYLDHLPMFFMQNHMYHLVLEVTIPEEAKKAYLADQEKHPDSFYILGNLQNDMFTLPAVAIGETTSFQADIFRGLPEDPNEDTPLIHNITTEIKQLIRLRHFDYNQPFPENLTYVLFGNEKEAFLSHYLTKQPDFMHVVQLKESPEWLQIQQLKMGIDINFTGMQDTPVYCSSPIKTGSYKVMYQGQSDTSFVVKVSRSIFFSTDVPNSTDPCAQ
jgi:hypothetical protein